MLFSGRLASLGALTLAAVLPAPVFGQAYITKPLHLIILGAGSAADLVARLTGTARSPGIGQQVVVATGVPGYESVLISGVYTPAKTPATIINFLNQEIGRALKKPEIKEKLFVAGAEVIAGSPDELMARVKSEMTIWSKVIKEAGIRTE